MVPTAYTGNLDASPLFPRHLSPLSTADRLSLQRKVVQRINMNFSVQNLLSDISHVDKISLKNQYKIDIRIA